MISQWQTATVVKHCLPRFRQAEVLRNITKRRGRPDVRVNSLCLACTRTVAASHLLCIDSISTSLLSHVNRSSYVLTGAERVGLTGGVWELWSLSM